MYSFTCDGVLHKYFWPCHKSLVLVKLSSAFETIAASVASNEGIVITHLISIHLGYVSLSTTLDPENLSKLHMHNRDDRETGRGP